MQLAQVNWILNLLLLCVHPRWTGREVTASSTSHLLGIARTNFVLFSIAIIELGRLRMAKSSSVGVPGAVSKSGSVLHSPHPPRYPPPPESSRLLPTRYTRDLGYGPLDPPCLPPPQDPEHRPSYPPACPPPPLDPEHRPRVPPRQYILTRTMLTRTILARTILTQTTRPSLPGWRHHICERPPVYSPPLVEGKYVAMVFNVAEEEALEEYLLVEESLLEEVDMLASTFEDPDATLTDSELS